MTRIKSAADQTQTSNGLNFHSAFLCGVNFKSSHLTFIYLLKFYFAHLNFNLPTFYWVFELPHLSSPHTKICSDCYLEVKKSRSEFLNLNLLCHQLKGACCPSEWE